MENCFHICSWSGGKDSTASIILAHEHNEPLDVIIFSEVMFDKKNKVSGENPRHIDFVYNIAKPVFESWGYKVLILHSDVDYLDVFHRIMKHPRKHMEHKGMKYGFSISGRCSVKRDCKMRPINKFYKSLDKNYKEYIGIAIDEPKRLISMHKNPQKISLLEKYNLTEQDAFELCKRYGLLSPTYLGPKGIKRGGCWMCPNAKLCEHQEISQIYPDSWKAFVELENEENVAQPKWNVFGETLAERNKQIANSYKQLSLTDFGINLET